jgi:hypothetical protein
MALLRLATYADGACTVDVEIVAGELVGLEVANTTGRDVVVHLGREHVTLAGRSPRLLLPARSRRVVTVDRETGRVDGLGDVAVSWG